MEHDVPEVGEAGGRDRAEEIAPQEPSFPQQPFEGGTVEPQEAHIEQDVYQAKMNEGGTEESPVVALLKRIGGEQERAPDVPCCRIDQQKDRYVNDQNRAYDLGVWGVVGELESVFVASLLLEGLGDFACSVARTAVGRAPDRARTVAGLAFIAGTPRRALRPLARASGTLDGALASALGTFSASLTSWTIHAVTVTLSSRIVAPSRQDPKRS